MSIKAIRYVSTDRVRILACMARGGQFSQGRRTISGISDDTELTEETVNVIIQRLIRLGVVKKSTIKGSGDSDYYELNENETPMTAARRTTWRPIHALSTLAKRLGNRDPIEISDQKKTSNYVTPRSCSNDDDESLPSHLDDDYGSGLTGRVGERYTVDRGPWPHMYMAGDQM